MRLRLLTLLLCAATGSALADPGRLIRATEMRAEPFNDAAVISELATDTAVSVVERKGGWYKVEAPRGTGWVRMTALRFGEATGGGVGLKGLGQTLQFATTGRSGSSGITAATGVKGITQEQMRNASPDYRGLAALDRYGATVREARDFAEKGRLASNRIDYPSSARSSGGNGTGTGTFETMPEGGSAW